MSTYDDLLSGALPLPSAASGSSDNWLSDLGSAVTSIVSGAGSYFLNQNAIKGAMKAATAQSGGRPILQYPGLGYSANQLVPFGASGGQATALPASYMNLGGPGGISLGSGDMPVVAGGSSSPIPRRPIYVTYTDSRGGTHVSGMRSLGRPLLWSGDLAAVKRVARVARKLGRFSHRARSRF